MSIKLGSGLDWLTLISFLTTGLLTMEVWMLSRRIDALSGRNDMEGLYVSYRGAFLLPVAGVACLLALIGQSLGAAIVMTLVLAFRLVGIDAVFAGAEGVHCLRHGRAAIQPWSQIDSAIAIYELNDGVVSYSCKIASGSNRSICFRLADPNDFLETMTRYGVPTATYDDPALPPPALLPSRDENSRTRPRVLDSPRLHPGATKSRAAETLRGVV